MKFLKYLLPFALATCGFTASLRAQDNDFATTVEERERDMQAVYDFVKSKRAISAAEKGGNLSISGDVRANWEHMHARTRWKRQRGKHSANLGPQSLYFGGSRELINHKDARGRHAPYPTNEFDIEANLMFDYRTERTWAAVQLQFDNTMGIVYKDLKHNVNDNRRNLFGSGTLDDIVLRKAYMGYNIAEMGTSRLDIEVGRRRLYDVFDSRVEFYNFFDGVLLRYAQSFEGLADVTAKAAAFVIDETVNHFGWVTEVGFLNMMDMGADFKYSFIDWDKDGHNRYHKKHPLGVRYEVSQWAGAYNFNPDWLRFKSQVYGAFLLNHGADRTHWTHHKRENKAWYAGMKVGEVRKKNDWAIDANYQWVQPQAIPSSDDSGIGRDNPRGINFYDRRSGGFGNYKGYQIDGFYALTDNLTLNAHWDQVTECSHRVGGSHRSYEFKLAAIYAF